MNWLKIAIMGENLLVRWKHEDDIDYRYVLARWVQPDGEGTDGWWKTWDGWREHEHCFFWDNWPEGFEFAVLEGISP